MKDVIYDMAFSMVSNITPFEKQALFNKYGSSREILSLPVSLLKTIIGRSWGDSSYKPDLLLRQAEEVYPFMEKSGIKTARFDEDNYPAALKEIPDLPFLIYYRGNINYDYNKSIAIVGTRKPDDDGVKYSENFGNMLAKNDYVIISGLASGVDGIVHKQSIDNKTPAIAVLGSGIDRIYPALHKGLARRILDTGGGIISEYHPGVIPRKWYFPKRNRIITALSKSVLITQAPEKSGSIITGLLCADYNKDLYVVDYLKYTDKSMGNKFLIENGGQSVRNVNELMEFLD